MTQKVHPSFDRDIRNRELVTAIQQGGGSDGWISEAGTRLVADSEGDLPTGDLGTFAYASSSGTTVTIGAGEALVGGAYMATDEQFDVDLDDSTDNQTVYVGWRDGLADTIVVGVDSSFSADDHRIPAWEFDTDASSVTASRDLRDLGQTLAATSITAPLNTVKRSLPSGSAATISEDESMIVEDYYEVHGTLTINGTLVITTHDN